MGLDFRTLEGLGLDSTRIADMQLHVGFFLCESSLCLHRTRFRGFMSVSLVLEKTAYCGGFNHYQYHVSRFFGQIWNPGIGNESDFGN